MNKDIEQRFKKYIKLKKKNNEHLDTIKKSREICIKVIDDAITKVKAIENKYIEGYELRIANETKNSIDSKEFIKYEEWGFYGDEPENLENIQTDIVLKNKEEEITIGRIDCDIKVFNGMFIGDLKRYNVHINRISIFDKYKDKGYGTFILRHIPMIISDLYKGEVSRVTTTIEVIEFDKYKIHETKYSERIEVIKKWLESNNYIEDSEYIKFKSHERLVFKLEENKKSNFKEILACLEEEISHLCFDVWRNDNNRHINSQIEECEQLVDNLLDKKYSLGTKDKKILGLENVKEKFIKEYDKKKEIRENEIRLIDNVIQSYNSISRDQLEILGKDNFDDILIKLYCKFFNLRRVSETLEELGYTGENKKGEKRKYTDEQVRNMINDSKTNYKELGKYAKCILIANRISMYV